MPVVLNQKGSNDASNSEFRHTRYSLHVKMEFFI